MLVAVLTNPTIEDHRNKVISSYSSPESDTQSIVAKQKVSTKEFKEYIDAIISSDSYVLFSLTKASWQGEKATVGFACLGNIFLFKDELTFNEPNTGQSALNPSKKKNGDVTKNNVEGQTNDESNFKTKVYNKQFLDEVLRRLKTTALIEIKEDGANFGVEDYQSSFDEFMQQKKETLGGNDYTYSAENDKTDPNIVKIFVSLRNDSEDIDNFFLDYLVREGRFIYQMEASGE